MLIGCGKEAENKSECGRKEREKDDLKIQERKDVSCEKGVPRVLRTGLRRSNIWGRRRN